MGRAFCFVFIGEITKKMRYKNFEKIGEKELRQDEKRQKKIDKMVERKDKKEMDKWLRDWNKSM